MRYVFETSKNGDEFTIKFTVGENASAFSNSAQHFLTISGENPQWNAECPEILKSLVDNLRFSVSERKNAEQDLNMFLGFLYGNLLASMTKANKEEMIVENGDPAVIGPKDEE